MRLSSRLEDPHDDWFRHDHLGYHASHCTLAALSACDYEIAASEIQCRRNLAELRIGPCNPTIEYGSNSSRQMYNLDRFSYLRKFGVSLNLTRLDV